jgi:membrane-bound serine protease (ClpP class)
MTTAAVGALLDTITTPVMHRPGPGVPTRAALHPRSGGAASSQTSLVEAGGETGTSLASDSASASAALELLAVPEAAFVLVAAGILASAIWAAQPHLWLSGLVAVPTLGAGSAGLVLGPTSSGALLLLALAVAGLAMEVYSLPGLMVHAAGGATALAIAGLCLHGPDGGAHPGAAIPAALVVGLATWAAARRSWRATRVEPLDVSPRLIGREAVVLHVSDDHTGVAVVAGRLWTIHDPDRPLRAGIPTVVAGRRGEALLVRQRGRSSRSWRDL